MELPASLFGLNVPSQSGEYDLVCLHLLTLLPPSTKWRSSPRPWNHAPVLYFSSHTFQLPILWGSPSELSRLAFYHLLKDSTSTFKRIIIFFQPSPLPSSPYIFQSDPWSWVLHFQTSHSHLLLSHPRHLLSSLRSPMTWPLWLPSH